MYKYVLVLAALVVAAPAMAQVAPGDHWNLIESITPLAQVSEVERAPGEVARYQVDFARRLFDPETLRAGDQVRLELPAGAQVFDVSRVWTVTEGTASVAGVAADGSGDIVAVTVAADGAAGVVSLGDLLYHVQWADGAPVLVQVDPDGVDHLECDITEHEMPDASFDLSPSAMERAAAPFNMNTLGDYGGDPITIDVLLAYTSNAVSWSNLNHGGIGAVIAQMMNLSQLALDNSDTNVVLRIVHSYEVDYNENIPNIPGVSASGSHLRRFTASPTYNPWGAPASGFMEEVHDLRDQYGADLVSLLAQVSGFGGVAWLLGNIEGSPHHGFSVNRVQQMATGYTFVHEIGHNMGNHHSRNQSSAAAGERGGIFGYSTGWRFDAPNNPSFNSYATVMTYTMSGSPRRPYFSNPDIAYEGVPTGSYTGFHAPADNARSMRETKRVIAAYRPTVFEPPTIAVAPDEVELNVEVGGTISQSLQVFNDGASDLMWELDLRPPAAARPVNTGAFTEQVADDMAALPMATSDGNHLSPTEALRDDGIIYQTDFTAADGFAAGNHQFASGWTARSDATPFWIRSENPSSGSQHLRVEVPSESSSSAWVHSPFFGTWPTGAYEFSMDVSISELGGPPHFVVLRDGRTGQTTAGFLLVGSGQVMVFNGLSGAGSNTYTPTDHTWAEGVYQQVVIRVWPEEGEVDYLFDDEVVATQPVFAGSNFGQLQITRSSGSTSIYMDVDNVSVRQLYAGLDWLAIEPYAGVTAPGGSSDIMLNFDAASLEPGTHSATLVIRTNLADTPEIEIPIDLAIGSIGTENGPDGLADRLLGNHPNPARDATTIGYELAHGGQVTLELFSITGQRVAVLVDDYASAGTHQVSVDTGRLASGVYLYRLRTDRTVESGRLVVVR